MIKKLSTFIVVTFLFVEAAPIFAASDVSSLLEQAKQYASDANYSAAEAIAGKLLAENRPSVELV